jgi:signal transduction histidine kinase/ActR/RegA family two-component response regulator
MLVSGSTRVVEFVTRLAGIETTRARYAAAMVAAVLCVALAWWARLAPETGGPFVLYVLVVVFAAWIGGLGPGLLATAVMDLASLLFLEERHDFPAVVLRHLGFLSAGAAISVLGEVLHEARRLQLGGERRAERLAELQTQLENEATGAVDALRLPQMAATLVSHGCALLGASAGRLAILDEGGSILRTVYATGYPAALDEREAVDIGSDDPLAEAVRRGAPVIIESRADSDARYPHLAPLRELTGTEAVAALPLGVEGRFLGGIAFSFRDARRFRSSRISLMQALAYHAALALESAQRYRREQALRERAEILVERHRFMAAANACLASSLDSTANLRELSRLAVPSFADACLVHLRGEAGGPSFLAAVHAEPESAETLERVGRLQTGAASRPEGLWRAFHSGQAELLNEDAAACWHERAGSASDGELADRLDLQSSISVPLVGHDGCLGSITFLTSRRGRLLKIEDLDLALNLGARAASTIDSALLYAKAQRLNRVKDEFLALLSHELRTPLGSMAIWVDLLKRETLGPSASRAVGMLDRSAHQLQDLIDRLLDVSGIAAGTLSIEKRATTLPSVLENVIALMEPTARARRIQLETSVDRSLTSFWGDPARLEQAVTSLVHNAIKFSPAGSTVSVRLERRDGRARLEVRDQGAGIAPEMMPFLFERFRQADTRTTRAHGGLGLGLAIAKYVVEQHDGSIRAESLGPDAGSVFIVDLPLRLPPGSEQASGSPAPKFPLRSLRVLLADDHEDTLRGLALGLEAFGAEVTPASSAREALAILPRLRPHVLVTDLAMPEKDGYTLISEIRLLEPEAGGLVPAVAVSAHATPDDRRRVLRAGFQDHLAKPIKMSELVATVERLARRDSSAD